MNKLGKFFLGLLYAAIPILGWIALWRSFKRVKSNEILVVQKAGGGVELVEQEGIYFKPIPGDSFGRTYSKDTDYIDFGPLKRVRVKQGQIAYKTGSDGNLVRLAPGIHIINTGNNEAFNPQTDIKNIADYLDFGALKIVRINPGQLGVKADRNGNLVKLTPGVHVIDTARNEVFNPQTDVKNVSDDLLDFGALKIIRVHAGQLAVKLNRDGQYIELPPGIHEIDVKNNETFGGIQDINQDDFILGNKRYITIRNGELGESYKNGIFHLLEPGRHVLPAEHRFVKKISVQNDIVDLGAYKVITVKEGQVAVINTIKGVVTRGPGKHEVKQEEGNFFNSIITTSPQGVNLPPLTVMCSDQIEMKAKAMIIYTVEEPLKTVGLGIHEIIDVLKTFADGTLRRIISRYNSADIAPSLHTDDSHDSSKRSDKLTKIHDESVRSLDEKAKDWGLRISDLQITEILPADEVYHNTLRELGTQQSKAEANRRIAESKAEIGRIEAKAQETAAEIAKRTAIIKADTEAQTKSIEAKTQAQQLITLAEAKAQEINTIAAAESERIHKMGEAARKAPEITHQVMIIEAQGKVLANLKNPVVLQPSLGETTRISRDGDGLTLFSNRQQNKRPFSADVIDINTLKNQVDTLVPENTTTISLNT